MTEQDFLELIAIDENTNRLKHRENSQLEFKANFNKADFALYAKTLAAFSNNQGGIIVFGVKDKPREAIGMTNNNLENLDNKDFSNFLNESFAPEIFFNIEIFYVNGKAFGIIEVKESANKPLVCIKNNGKKQEILEGEIYYRYSGRSEKIRYSELKNILDKNLEIERQKWREHIENIARIGPKNVKMLDLLRGEIDDGNGKKIVVDRELLKELHLVTEGKFVEKDGAPTLMLVGTIQNGEIVVPNLNLEKDYFTTKELLERLGLSLSHHYFRGVLAEYPIIQQDTKYFQQKKKQKYYSSFCLDFLKQQNLSEDKIKTLCRKHNIWKKN
ncbi:ATP-binding protein, partial [Campylobacter coli]|nr:ATP-binding protein [Campylobacter coli]EDO7690448.1 ATP-binding protein [Campylobacter coli]EFB5571128.1 ATP-binding protein [Campylobacter coli]ELB8350052.1 ATP-binding protein [Campylobacter coli]ELD0352544.1 ATP-binding protein [Campylobacter coli]